MRHAIALTGLTCAACVDRVSRALAPLDAGVKVTLAPPEAVFSSPPDRAAVAAALSAAGDYGIEGEPPDDSRGWLATYQPLLVIVTLIGLASFAGATESGEVQWHAWMTHFMAGFFLVFGGFKLIDLNGFATAYASYDLLAARSRVYGLIYPFLELALGFAFLFGLWPQAVLIATLVLMGFSSLGVMRALMHKRRIVCACLGTALKLPMSTVTLVEDLGMAAMAAVMLFL